jgi:hypothetical protein
MDKTKRNTAPLIAAACLFLFAAAAIAYVVGYFALSSSQVAQRDLLRVYPSETLAYAYLPMAAIEASTSGRKVAVAWKTR